MATAMRAASGAGPWVTEARRAAFSVAHLPPIQWFPGHMAKGLRAMQERLRGVDIIVEVRDARVR